MNTKLIESLPVDAIDMALTPQKCGEDGRSAMVSLAACRAVLFASIVDDPAGFYDDAPATEDQEAERERLLGIVAHLADAESSGDEHVLDIARAELRKSCSSLQCPPATDDFHVIVVEGHKFNGYEAFGGSPESMESFVLPMLQKFEQTGEWQGTHRELRGALFYLLRAHRFGGGYDPTSEEWRQFSTIYNAIRDRWGEVDIPSAVAQFFNTTHPLGDPALKVTHV